jgi:hypothetical protein
MKTTIYLLLALTAVIIAIGCLVTPRYGIVSCSRSCSWPDTKNLCADVPWQIEYGIKPSVIDALKDHTYFSELKLGDCK